MGRSRHGWASGSPSLRSASCFIYTTNQATRRAEAALHDRSRTEAVEDRAAATVITGSLLPRTPTPVQLKIPPDADASRVVRQLSVNGTSCDLATVQGVLIAIETPPVDDKTAVMRVVTLATSGCRPAEIWLPPEWLAPAKEAPESEGASSNSSTTTSLVPE